MRAVAGDGGGQRAAVAVEKKGKEVDSRYIKKLAERIELVDKVEYNDTSFNDFEKGIIQHDDVIEIAKLMYENYPLLTDIVSTKFPYVFVDEYQDTAEETIFCLLDCLLKRNKKNLVIGFYGDSHQKIYDYGIGDLEKYYTSKGGQIELVKKEENYRSSQSVVGLLNNFRKNIQQKPQKESKGSVKFVYWKNHPEKPKSKIREFNAEIAVNLLARFQFDLKFTLNWWPIFIILLLVILLTIAIGLFNSREVVSKPPLEVLRKEVD